MISVLFLCSSLPSQVCCCCSVAKLCPALCNSMECSTPGFLVLHYFQEFPQIHVHCGGDAIHYISSSVTLFSLCVQSFWASGSFPVSQLFASCGRSIGASASISVLPMISLQAYKGQEFSGGRSVLPPTEGLCLEQWLLVLGCAAVTSQLRDLNQVAWPFFASVSSFVKWEIQQCLSHRVVGRVNGFNTLHSPWKNFWHVVSAGGLLDVILSPRIC